MHWLLKRFRAAFAWSKALELSAAGHHDEALRVIRSVEPAPHLRSASRLFEILQLSLLGRSSETLAEAIQFVVEFDARPSLTMDGRYFRCFAQWCGAS